MVASVRAREPVAVATVIDGPGNVGAHLAVWPDRGRPGGLGTQRLDAPSPTTYAACSTTAPPACCRIGPDGERRQDELSVFVQSFAPPPRMLVFGAIDFAAAVARVGKFLGYRVTVCDARPVFATAQALPGRRRGRRRVAAPVPAADTEVDARTVICVLTHDPKFDVPLLEVALRPTRPTSARWAAGAPTTTGWPGCARRASSEEALARLASPIGLDIGARTPEETAVSIAAEIVALRWGGSGARLTAHRRPDPQQGGG